MISLFIFIIVLIILFGDTFGLIGGALFSLLDHALILFLVLLGMFFSLRFLFSERLGFKSLKSLILLVYLFSFVVLLRSFFNEHITLYGVFLGYIYYFKFLYLFICGLGIGFYIKGDASIFAKPFYFLVFMILIITSILNVLSPSLWHQIYPTQIVDGTPRLMGPFTNAGRTSWLIVFFMLYFLVYSRTNIVKYGVTACLFFIQLATFVKKSFFAYIISLLYYNKDTLKRKNRLYKSCIWLLVLLMLFFLSLLASSYFERIVSEYSGDALNSGNARYMLMVGAIDIIKADVINFFFGAGLSTWGGYASSIVYSEYYYMLGLSNNWGFIPGESTYTGDFYIAHVLGETGAFGLVLTILIFFNLFKVIDNTLKHPERELQKDMLFFKLAFLQLMIECIGISAVEINQIIILVLFVPGVILGCKMRKRLNDNVKYSIA